MGKILIVEDNLLVLELLDMVLKPRGHQITFTIDGSKAFELAADNQPDLIILDIMLPHLDGYSIQTALLQDPKTKDIPIIVVTSKVRAEELFTTTANVRGLLSKPFSVKELTQKVDSVLQPQAP